MCNIRTPVECSKSPVIDPRMRVLSLTTPPAVIASIPMTTGDGSATEDFWTTASDKDLKGAWHNLKLKRHSASGEADNMALVLLDRAGNGGICDEELQVTVPF